LPSGAGSTSPKPYNEALEEALAKKETLVSPERKTALRSLLRYGSYKPAGRAKPSSEYLLQSLLENDFPQVNYFVDSINLVSLVSAYPISIIDTDKAGEELLIRRGVDGEHYVFNQGGQSIDLKDLALRLSKKRGRLVTHCHSGAGLQWPQNFFLAHPEPSPLSMHPVGWKAVTSRQPANS